MMSVLLKFCVSICEFLLEAGMSPNDQDDDKDTPLINAIYNGSQPLGTVHVPCARSLIVV